VNQRIRILKDVNIDDVRKSGIHITPQEYQEYMESQGSSKIATQEGELTTELSFAEIKHLIETGQAHLIPNNKTIPDRLNVGVSTPHHASH